MELDDGEWIAERHCPGLSERGASAAISALRDACGQLSDTVTTVRVVAATWRPEDELLAVRFMGSRRAIVAVHEIAATRFDHLANIIELEV